MNVVDLHPEELLDKKEAGTLTPAEASRLEAHLAQCVACRFEIGARADFSAELEEEEALELSGHAKPGLVNAPLGAPLVARVEPLASESGASETGASDGAPRRVAEKAAEEPRPSPSIFAFAISKRRARRSAMVLLAAAALLVAGVGWGSWHEGGPRALFVALTSTRDPSPSVIERARPKPSSRGAATGGGTSVQTTPIDPNADDVVDSVQMPSIPEVVPTPASAITGSVPAFVEAPIAAPVRTSKASVNHRAAPEQASPARTSSLRATSIAAVASEHVAPARAVPAAELAAPPVASPPVASPETAPVAFASAPSLFDAANGARARGDRDRAIALYHDLQIRFAGTNEARVSRVTLGRFLLDGGDANGALRAFDTALGDRPGELEEEALVGRALALRRLGRDTDEAAAWTALLSAYPTSPHAARARARIATLAR